MDDSKVAEIEKVIEKIRPYLQRDGGDVQLSRVEGDIVYVTVHGACIGCNALDMTLKDGIEALLLDEVPDIREVRLDNELF